MDPRCLFLTSHTMQFDVAECSMDPYLPLQEGDSTGQLHILLEILSSFSRRCLKRSVICGHRPQNDLSISLPRRCDYSDRSRPTSQSSTLTTKAQLLPTASHNGFESEMLKVQHVSCISRCPNNHSSWNTSKLIGIFRCVSPLATTCRTTDSTRIACF